MKTQRKTGVEYRKEWDEIKRSQKSLKAHVDQRLRELLTIYPEAEISIIGGNGVEQMRCKDITAEWFDNLSTWGMIKYIQSIEKWSARKEKVEQLKIYNE